MVIGGSVAGILVAAVAAPFFHEASPVPVDRDEGDSIYA